MGLLRAALRIYSYLFQVLFALFLLSITVVWLLSGRSSFRLYILPWEGGKLACGLVLLAVAGMLVTWFAIKGALQRVFFIWNLFVLVLVLRGYFFSNYTFKPGTGSVTTAIWITLAAAIASGGACLHYRSPAEQKH